MDSFLNQILVSPTKNGCPWVSILRPGKEPNLCDHKDKAKKHKPCSRRSVLSPVSKSRPGAPSVRKLNYYLRSPHHLPAFGF